jgi:hypothetical protein
MCVSFAGRQARDTGQFVRKPLGALQRNATLRPRADAGSLVATAVPLTLSERVGAGARLPKYSKLLFHICMPMDWIC